MNYFKHIEKAQHDYNPHISEAVLLAQASVLLWFSACSALRCLPSVQSATTWNVPVPGRFLTDTIC